MTENPVPIDIGSLDLSGEKREIDLLAQHILAGRVHRADLFDGIVPKTPFEVERDTTNG